MSSPQEDFDKLKQVLVCKRYEQPPPGYFDRFSEKIVSRLEAEEFTEYSSWWQWLVEKFDARPVVACLYGCAVSGLLLTGFRLSQVFENEASAHSIDGSPWLGLAATAASTSLIPGELGQAVVMDSSVASSVFRTDSARLLFQETSLRTTSFSFNQAEY